ncbi:type IV secretory system conjugative DNA transfer family protein [Vibrio parahaemolyticus]|uniref:type IV secretory system conjugative DNA transfer family protein n=1 Tax=Vibrio parahaemolyticus TaxID=670 RepID=UPI001FAC2BBF|nr:type IV secretory system conjugative DNA transfer family protein [Vibrio parahaemolyticus]MCI9687719.1 type IV secretory system conjugative DNA transfer family protein [Vibrio parahaemolyticus]
MALSKKKKGILFAMFLFFTLLCFIGGLYGGGAAYYKLTHISLEHLTYHSLFDQWQAYRHNPDIKKFLVIGVAVSIAITLLPTLMAIVIAIASQEREEIHGSAKFATDMDLANSGLFPNPKAKNKKPSILLGKMTTGRFKGRFIELESSQFVEVPAPTRSGKGVGIVIPNCVTYPDSLVCVDIKFENLVKSGGFRQQCGQAVFLFAPDGYAIDEQAREREELRTHQWNPYDYVRRSPVFRVSDVLNIANSLYPISGDKGDIWNELAGKLFKGLSCWMLDTESITGITPSLPYVLKLGGIEGGLRAWMRREIKNDYVSDDARFEFNNCLSMAEDTYSSVESNLLSPLAIFSDRVTAAAVSGSDFDFRELRKKRMTIYVGCQPANLKNFGKLFNLFFEQLISENTRTLPEHDDTLKYQCLGLLDEFTALGRVKQIEKAISYTAGYNLRFLTIYQDEGQLEEVYGRENAKNIRKNHGVKVVYPPKEVDDNVRRLSDTLGTKTVKKRKVSRSTGKGSSRTTSEDELKRPLMMPHEIVELGFEKHPVAKELGIKTLILKENQRPFIAEKIIYFEEPVFAERVTYSQANIPEIPLLKLH